MQISLDFLNLHPLDLLLVSFQFFRLISFPFCQHRVDQHRHLPGRRRDRLLTAGVEGHPRKKFTSGFESFMLPIELATCRNVLGRFDLFFNVFRESTLPPVNATDVVGPVLNEALPHPH